MDTEKNSIPKIACNEIEAGECLNVSKYYMRKMRKNGGGPPFVKIGARVLYDVKDLHAWWNSQKKTS